MLLACHPSCSSCCIYRSTSAAHQCIGPAGLQVTQVLPHCTIPLLQSFIGGYLNLDSSHWYLPIVLWKAQPILHPGLVQTIHPSPSTMLSLSLTTRSLHTNGGACSPLISWEQKPQSENTSSQMASWPIPLIYFYIIYVHYYISKSKQLAYFSLHFWVGYSRLNWHIALDKSKNVFQDTLAKCHNCMTIYAVVQP